MTRLSDRTFQILKDEVNRYYAADPKQQLSQQQDIERVILLARLEALHEQGGQAVTQAQLWEEMCDIVPNFDRQILRRVGRVDITKPLSDVSFGLGVAGISAAMFLANPFNLQEGKSPGTSAQMTADTSAANGPSSVATATRNQRQQLYETARAFGWQAALKGQNPPHSVQHWRETASLWAQAIALLDQVPERDHYYTIAQTKKAEYEKNLKHIQARQAAAQNEDTLTPTPQFSKRIVQAQPQTQPSKQSAATVPATAANTATPQPEVAVQESALELAKQYGWEAAIAAQNAPHPAAKWADISRTWQLALHSLSKIDTEHPDYAEAQRVKARYEQNLYAIRTRYQQEQDASQRLQSLQASLLELDRLSPIASPTKDRQMQAIIERLQSIPTGTVAHKQAQQLIDGIDKSSQKEGHAIAISQ